MPTHYQKNVCGVERSNSVFLKQSTDCMCLSKQQACLGHTGWSALNYPVGYDCSWICKTHPQDNCRPVARDATRCLMPSGFEDAIGRRYNAVHFITILHTALRQQRQNINQTLDSQNAPHISPSRVSSEVSFVRIWEKIVRIIKGISLYITWTYHTYLHPVEILTTSFKHVVRMVFETQCLQYKI